WNGRMSVYLPRSAVRATICGRSAPSLARVSPNGASTDGFSNASSRPIAWVNAGFATEASLAIEFRQQRVPFVLLDPDEMSFPPRHQPRRSETRPGAQHDRVRLA